MNASTDGSGGSAGDEGSLCGGVAGGVGGIWHACDSGLGSQRMTSAALAAR